MSVKPLSDVELEPHGALRGIFLVPAHDAQQLAVAFIASFGTSTAAAVAYADRMGISPFSAHRNLLRWRSGKWRMRADTYDTLWTML